MIKVMIIIFCIFHCLSCTTYTTKKWNRGLYKPENNQVIQITNSDEFLSTSSVLTVTLLQSGYLEVMLSGAINLDHPNATLLKDEKIKVPIFSYLLHHETYGFFLIDTGCDSSYINNEYGRMKGRLIPSVMSPTFIDEKNTIDKQLINDIDSLDELKGVFFTHLHMDHTSGLPALPNELIYTAGKGEYIPSIPLLFETNHFKKDDVLHLIDFKTQDYYNSIAGKAIDIFGDGSLWAIHTPGHSKGHLSYLVNTPTKSILIAGDAVIINLSLELNVGPGDFSSNMGEAQETIEKISQFKQNYPELEIWAGHDWPEIY